MELRNKKILVTGAFGFLGTQVMKVLSRKGCKEYVGVGSDYDLRNEDITNSIIAGQDVVIHLAANCGGIGWNRRYPGSLFYDNMKMGMNVIEACRKNKVQKLLITGTVCSYPKYTRVPFSEEALWTGYPEETNAPYGISKKALLVMANSYRDQYGLNIIFLLPSNLYGVGDPGFFNEKKAHVIPAITRKVFDAKVTSRSEITLWGDGTPTREFLNVKDCAEAIYLALKNYNGAAPVNVGTGEEISVKDLASKISGLVGYAGRIRWDTSKPNGQPQRKLAVDKAKQLFGFESQVSFDQGLKETINWYTKERNTNG